MLSNSKCYSLFNGFLRTRSNKNFSISVLSWMTTHNVFVYGTLKRNEPNHHWITNPKNGQATFLGEATTINKYPLIIATKYNIPFLLKSAGKGNVVKGEVYEVDETMLMKLDELEDHPNFYIRELDNILLKSVSKSTPQTLQCWMYFIQTFKPDLLNLPLLEDYSSAGPHGLPYAERSSRDPNYNVRAVVKSNEE